MRSLFAVLTLSLCTACATAQPVPAGVAPNPAACAPVVARAVAGTDTAGMQPAALTRLHVPPPAPRHVSGRDLAVQVRVDEQGMPDAEQSVIRGVEDARYLAALRASLREYRFIPARLDGYWVPSTLDLVLTV